MAAGGNPYETEWPAATLESEVDRLVKAELGKRGIEEALSCSDDVFLRRATLDVTGELPTVQAYWEYQRMGKNRRRELIEKLLGSDGYVDYWTLKWADLLRIKAEFPINLWPNGVQAYHRWIEEAVAGNMRYDVFARQLLTSSGSNFRVAPVNFYRAVESQRPETIAAAVSLTLMGVRWNSWTEQQRADMAHIFSRVAFKKTDEWKEEIVYLDPAQYGPMTIAFPDGTTAQLPAGADPREAFADWLIRPENPWFARNLANRAWSWLMGRGLIHEPDDIRPDNPCVNPGLLAHLEATLVESGYDMKALFREILNSRTYQQSSIPRTNHPEAASLFAHYSVRRLDAEVLADALTGLKGTGEVYQSPVPEPFTFVPEYHKTVELADGSISSQFLEKFGRPGRDTGLESERDNSYSVDQGMYLINSSEIQKQVLGGQRLNNLIRQGRNDPDKVINAMYRLLLTRAPTDNELALARDYLDAGGRPQQAYQDLCWALINSKEFLYRH